MDLCKRNEFNENIQRNFKDGTRCIVTVQNIYKKRTSKGNAYYWLLVDILYRGLIEIGWSDFKNNEQVHELLKFKFLKTEIANQETGEFIEYIRSTTDLSTVEFAEYIEEIKIWSAEMFGIKLPEPNEQMEIFT